MLYIVGFGPGSYEQMTVEADRALQESDLIIGYTTYVDIIRPWFPGKEFLVTPMKQEKERCRIAIEEEKLSKTESAAAPKAIRFCAYTTLPAGSGGTICGWPAISSWRSVPDRRSAVMCRI